MKKLLVAAGCLFLLAACTKHAEQIDVAKTKMKTWNLPEEEISSYKFQTDEALDKDVYKIIAADYTKLYHQYQNTNLDMAETNLTEAGKYIGLAEKASNKTFYIVKAYSIAAGDTIHKKIFFIDDKNAIVDVINTK